MNHFSMRLLGLLFALPFLFHPDEAASQETWQRSWEKSHRISLPARLPRGDQITIWEDSLFVVYTNLEDMQRYTGWPCLIDPFSRLDADWLPAVLEDFNSEAGEEVYAWAEENDHTRRLAWIVIGMIERGDCIIYAKSRMRRPIRWITMEQSYSGGFELWGYTDLRLRRGRKTLFYRITSYS
ncbi:MAG: hypothetical protein RJA19_968 [Bacteroidota bacterium]